MSENTITMYDLIGLKYEMKGQINELKLEQSLKINKLEYDHSIEIAKIECQQKLEIFELNQRLEVHNQKSKTDEVQRPKTNENEIDRSFGWGGTSLRERYDDY